MDPNIPPNLRLTQHEADMKLTLVKITIIIIINKLLKINQY